MLIENGVNVDEVDPYYQRTPAHWASFYGLLEILRLLINARELLNLSFQAFCCPNYLHGYLMCGNLHIVVMSCMSLA